MRNTMVRYNEVPATVIVVPTGVASVTNVIAAATQAGMLGGKEILEWRDVVMLACQAVIDKEMEDDDWYYDNCYTRVEELTRTWLGKIESTYHSNTNPSSNRRAIEKGIRRQLEKLVDAIMTFASALECKIMPVLNSLDGFFENGGEYEVVSVQRTHTGLRFVLQDLGYDESW